MSRLPSTFDHWSLRLLRVFCREDYVDDIEGDLLERYAHEYQGSKFASWLLIWEVIRLFRPGIVRPLFNSHKLKFFFTMRYDIRTSFRYMRREAGYTAINVLGLALGLAIALLIIQYVRYEFSYESSNPQADRMVRVTMDYLDGETVVDQDCETYPPLGPRIKREFAEVVDFVRAYDLDVTPKVQERSFTGLRAFAVDPSFFELMDYPLLQGNQETALHAPLEVVVSEGTAMKFFGTTDVMGRRVELTNEQAAEIVGVMPDSPGNTHIKFDMLISMETLFSLELDRPDNWNGNNTFTYLLLDDAANYGRFLSNLEQLNKRLWEEKKILSERVIAQPMTDIHLHSDKSFEAEVNGDYYSVLFLLGVALLVIVIAVVNYINLSTSKSLDRAKEVGIRKVLGSSTALLRRQFVTESVLMNLLAGLVALLFIVIALRPFEVLADLPDDFELLTSPFFWLSFALVLVVNSILSGVFPAFILSSFKPLAALGKFGVSPRGAGLRRVLVVLQFAVTSFLLILTLVIAEQIQHMREKDLGIDIERVIVVEAPAAGVSRQQSKAFASLLREHEDFEDVSTSDCLPGMPSHAMSTTTGVNPIDALEKPNNNMYIYFIDERFIPTLGIDVLAGDNFIDGEPENVMIVNAETVKVWGYASPEEALEHRIGMWGREWQVKAVVESFHQVSPKDPHIPMVFVYYGGESSVAYFAAKTTPGNIRDKVATMEAMYKEVFPTSTLNYFFLDEYFNRQYNEDRRFQQVFSVLTGFALFIAALGLFGLASFSIAKRSKEIGIRKVLGATVFQLVGLISSSFLSLVGISFLVTVPFAIYFINSWLDQFSYRIDLAVWMFVVPGVAVILIAFFSIFSKTYGVSTGNPATALRDE